MLVINTDGTYVWMAFFFVELLQDPNTCFTDGEIRRKREEDFISLNANQ